MVKRNCLYTNKSRLKMTISPLLAVRNLLIMAAAVSLIVGIALLITSVMLLDALRKEQEHAFIGR